VRAAPETRENGGEGPTGSGTATVVNSDMALPDNAFSEVPFEVFQGLPKTDLHVHLDGSLRVETILDIAEKDHIDLPAKDRAGLVAAIGCGSQFGSLVEYLRGFDITLRVMQTEEALERIAFELAEDAHRENVRYMEVRYAPVSGARARRTE
jgi:adenosine deaminase